MLLTAVLLQSLTFHRDDKSPQTGQVVPGYYITAYRNLTTVSTLSLSPIRS